METFLDKFYKFFVSQRQKIIDIFKIIYFLLIFLVILVFLFFRKNDSSLLLFYSFGKIAGELSLITYLLTLLPGMGERFGLRMRIFSILRIYRRYIGILMFFFALVHLAFVKMLFVISVKDLLPYGVFEVMGVIAFILFLFLFITSNNTSVSRFKIWWYRIQRFTYLGMFFIFLHVALISLNIWTVLMGLVIILQAVSFVFIYKKTHSLTGGKPI